MVVSALGVDICTMCTTMLVQSQPYKIQSNTLMVVSALGVDISLPVFGSGRVGTGHQDTRQGGHQGIEIHTRPPPPQPRGAQPSAGGTDPPLQFLVQHNNHDTEEHNVHNHTIQTQSQPCKTQNNPMQTAKPQPQTRSRTTAQQKNFFTVDCNNMQYHNTWQADKIEM